MGLVAYQGKSTVQGGLADLWVDNVVREHMDQIRATIERFAPGVQGRAHFAVTIDGRGEIVRASVRSSFGIPELDAALANALADLRFPTAEDGFRETSASWEVQIAPPPVMAIPQNKP